MTAFSNSQLPADLAACFIPDTRLYRITGAGLDQLMVERWQSASALSEPAELQISAISLDSQLDLVGFVGQPVTLIATRADGSDIPQTRLVRNTENWPATAVWRVIA